MTLAASKYWGWLSALQTHPVSIATSRAVLRQGASRSYFAGCSNGGREAMLMAQRYPTYFDGIVAGAPAMRAGFSNIGDRWVAACGSPLSCALVTG